ncbi:MAG: hypothetical protein ABIK28_21420, partial [Planctomycetota bacterium]
DQRVITGELELVELADNTVQAGAIWNTEYQALVIRFGPATAAKKCTISIPKALVKVKKRGFSDGEATKVTISFVAKMSAAAEDEITVAFD